MTVMISQWRNDTNKNLAERAFHLLDKQGVDRWIWITGNNDDATERVLRAIACEYPAVEIVHFDSEVLGDDPNSRLLRLSQSLEAGLKAVRSTDDYVLLHESDLISPVDLVPRLMATQDGKRAVAGWVTLGNDYPGTFYDSWGMRADGQKFSNNPPYSHAYKPNEPFELDSVGSVVLFPAKPVVDGLTLERGAIVELCMKLKQQGFTMWLDPRIHIVQPIDLWKSAAHADF